MTSYPPPHKASIFNPIDFETDPEVIKDDDNSECCIGGTDTYDHTTLVEKTGDTMTGNLTIPAIHFSGDSTHQTTAFTNTNKEQIGTNAGDIVTIKNITDHITSDVNNNMTFVNGITAVEGDFQSLNCVGMTTDLMIIDGETQQNAFTNDDHDQIEINKNLLDGVSGDIDHYVLSNKVFNSRDAPVDGAIVNDINSESYFDKNISLMRTSSEYRKYWIGLTGDDATATNSLAFACNGNSAQTEILMVLDNDGHLETNGQVSCSGIKIGSELQENAFTNTDHEKINVILDVDSVQTKQTHITTYQNPQDNTEGVGYIGSDNAGGRMHIVTYNNKPIIFHADSYVSHWAPDVYVGRYSQDSVLYIRGTGKIVMNGEEQNDAYTSADHDKVAEIPSIIEDLDIVTTQSNQNKTDIETNASNIASMSSSTIKTAQVDLNMSDLLDRTSISNNSSTGLMEHDFNLGKWIYDNTTMTGFDSYGRWNSSNAVFEISFQMKLSVSYDTINRCQVGFRNLLSPALSGAGVISPDFTMPEEDTSTLTYAVDAGMVGNSNNYKSYRFGTSMILHSRLDLVHNYILYLKTRVDLQTNNSGTKSIAGVVNIKKLK